MKTISLALALALSASATPTFHTNWGTQDVTSQFNQHLTWTQDTDGLLKSSVKNLEMFYDSPNDKMIFDNTTADLLKVNVGWKAFWFTSNQGIKLGDGTGTLKVYYGSVDDSSEYKLDLSTATGTSFKGNLIVHSDLGGSTKTPTFIGKFGGDFVGNISVIPKSTMHKLDITFLNDSKLDGDISFDVSNGSIITFEKNGEITGGVKMLSSGYHLTSTINFNGATGAIGDIDVAFNNSLTGLKTLNINANAFTIKNTMKLHSGVINTKLGGESSIKTLDLSRTQALFSENKNPYNLTIDSIVFDNTPITLKFSGDKSSVIVNQTLDTKTNMIDLEGTSLTLKGQDNIVKGFNHTGNITLAFDGNTTMSDKFVTEATQTNVIRVGNAKLTLENGFSNKGNTKFFVDGNLAFGSNFTSIDNEGTLQMDLKNAENLNGFTLNGLANSKSTYIFGGGNAVIKDATVTDGMMSFFQSAKAGASEYGISFDNIRATNSGLEVSSGVFDVKGELSLNNSSAIISSSKSASIGTLTLTSGIMELSSAEISIKTLTLDTNSRLNLSNRLILEGVSSLSLTGSGSQYTMSGSANKLSISDSTLTMNGSVGTFENSGTTYLLANGNLDIGSMNNVDAGNILVYNPIISSNALLKVDAVNGTQTYHTLVTESGAKGAKIALIKDGVLDLGDRTVDFITDDFSLYQYELVKSQENGYTAYTLGEMKETVVDAGSSDNGLKPLMTSIVFDSKALYLANFNSLNKRMGELRDNNNAHGTWGRVFAGGQSSNVEMGYKSSFVTLQTGYDYGFKINDATNYLGASFAYSYSKGDVKQTRNYAGLFDLGINQFDSNVIELGLYNSYVQDNGWFNDTVMKLSFLLNDVKFGASSNISNSNSWSGGMNSTAFTLSNEFGYRFKINEWYIDPQLEFGFGYVSGGDLKFSNTIFGSTKDLFVTRTRLGSSFGYDFKNLITKEDLEASMYVGLFAELDSYSGGDSVIFANNYKYPLNFDARGVFNIGTNVKFGKQYRFYADIENNFGGKTNTDWKINAGFRYSFGEKMDYSDLKDIKPVEVKDAPMKLKDENKETTSSDKK